MTEKTEKISCDYIAGENWKAFGNYFVSDYGRIYSCYKKKIIKPNITSNLYYRIDIWNGGKVKRIRVHRLVAMLFIPNPNNKPYIHHIDGNRLNNKVDNLLWVTRDEHTQIHRQMRERKGA